MTRSDETAVMGGGLAKQATDRFDHLETRLGQKLEENGNQVYTLKPLRPLGSIGWLINFPTKHHYRDDSILELIERSARQTRTLYETNQPDGPIVLPEVGCGLGGLSFEEVGPVLDSTLPADTIIVRYAPSPSPDTSP